MGLIIPGSRVRVPPSELCASRRPPLSWWARTSLALVAQFGKSGRLKPGDMRGFESCRGHFVGGRRVFFVLFTPVCSRGGAVGPHFSCVVRYLELLRHAVACAPGSLRGVVRGFWCWVRVLGHLLRESQREARTACLALVFGRYGGRAVLHGFCGGAIVVCGGWR